MGLYLTPQGSGGRCAGARGWKDPDGKAVPECDRPHDSGDSGRFARQRDGGYQGMCSKGTGGGDRLLQRRSDQNLIS